jgi:hypothetical protein
VKKNCQRNAILIRLREHSPESRQCYCTMQGQPPTAHSHPFSNSFTTTVLQTYMQGILVIEGGTLVAAGYDTEYSQLPSAILHALSPLLT